MKIIKNIAFCISLFFGMMITCALGSIFVSLNTEKVFFFQWSEGARLAFLVTYLFLSVCGKIAANSNELS